MARNNTNFLLVYLGKLKAKLYPSYTDLLAEKERLKQIVRHWQYPDGTHVPQEKRHRLFGELHRLSKDIERHPDHPEQSEKRKHG